MVPTQPMATIHKFGPYRLDADAEILFRGGEPIALGQRAVTLLRLLLERPGAPVSKAALIEGAWPGLAIEDGNLTVQIAALRRVFEQADGGAAWIETLPRRGYRYVGPTVATDTPLPEANTQPSPQLALSDKPSVSVLPFSNLSGDPAQEYFAGGMVEDIIAGLSRIKWLFVIASNSSSTYKDSRRETRGSRTRRALPAARKRAQRWRSCPHLRADDRSGNRARFMGRTLRSRSRSHFRAAR